MLMSTRFEVDVLSLNASVQTQERHREGDKRVERDPGNESPTSESEAASIAP